MLYFGMNYYLPREEDEKVKWLKHYSSNHSILVVGDGDFSFSLCLARSFGSAFNIVTTSLDSYDELTKKYKEAKSNLLILHGLGACVLHRVDATKMKFHDYLMSRKFDRIIFNFPHAGFKGKEDSSRVIKMHRALVNGFFSNAKSMLRPDGEIHITHKTTPPFSDWKLEELASSNSLALIDRAEFKKEDYRNYNLKRGDGRRCDQSFPCGESSTFKFIFSPNLHKSHQTPEAHYWGSLRTRSEYLFDQNLISNVNHSTSTTDRGHYWGSIRTSSDYSFDRITHVQPRGTSPGFDRLVGPAPGRSLSQRLEFLPESDRGRISYDDDYRSGFNGGSTGIGPRLSYYGTGHVNASRLVRKYGKQDEHFSGEGNLRITRIIP